MATQEAVERVVSNPIITLIFRGVVGLLTIIGIPYLVWTVNNIYDTTKEVALLAIRENGLEKQEDILRNRLDNIDNLIVQGRDQRFTKIDAAALSAALNQRVDDLRSSVSRLDGKVDLMGERVLNGLRGK